MKLVSSIYASMHLVLEEGWEGVEVQGLSEGGRYLYEVPDGVADRLAACSRGNEYLVMELQGSLAADIDLSRTETVPPEDESETSGKRGRRR